MLGDAAPVMSGHWARSVVRRGASRSASSAAASAPWPAPRAACASPHNNATPRSARSASAARSSPSSSQRAGSRRRREHEPELLDLENDVVRARSLCRRRPPTGRAGPSDAGRRRGARRRRRSAAASGRAGRPRARVAEGNTASPSGWNRACSLASPRRPLRTTSDCEQWATWRCSSSREAEARTHTDRGQFRFPVVRMKREATYAPRRAHRSWARTWSLGVVSGCE